MQMASSGKLSSWRTEIKYVFFVFCRFSKMIFFYEVQRVLVLFHSSGVFPASGGKTNKKKLLLGEEVFLTWWQVPLDGMLMLWRRSSHASVPLLGIKGQDLCLLYVEVFGNIKSEVLYNPGHVADLLFWMNVLFSSALRCMLVTPQRNTFIGEHFYGLLFCLLLYFLQVMKKYSFGSSHSHKVLSLRSREM